jgi:hypothetical protein
MQEPLWTHDSSDVDGDDKLVESCHALNGIAKLRVPEFVDEGKPNLLRGTSV